MRLSESARKARKKMQLARLAAKGKKKYAAIYADQPSQKAQRAAFDQSQATLSQELSAVEKGLVENAEASAKIFGKEAN